MPVARLYHHLKLLQKVGVVVVADERRAGSNIEKRYRVAAARIEMTGTVAGDRDGGAVGAQPLEVHALPGRQGESVGRVEAPA